MIDRAWRTTAAPPSGLLDHREDASRPARPSLPLPPSPMRVFRGSRPLKRWCYVGVYAEDLMICAGSVRVGGLPQSFWAVWDRLRGQLEGQTLMVRTGRVDVTPARVRVRSGPARLELSVSPAGPAVEVVSPHGGSYIWTRKVPVRVQGHFAAGLEARSVSGFGIVDESAGYHARHTAWEWSAGVGTATTGGPVVWNLVSGVHDYDAASERTVWAGGIPAEVGPVRFSPDLDQIWSADGGTLRFEAEATRRRRDNLGLVRSDYVQPFGRFSGRLPGGTELAADRPALGVMERHRATW